MKWVCTGIAMLMGASWSTSFGIELRAGSVSPRRTVYLTLSGGTLWFQNMQWTGSPPLTPRPLLVKMRTREWDDYPRVRWLPSWVMVSGYQEYGLPVWMLLAPTTVGAVALWRADHLRRSRCAKTCASCGYDRRGLAVGAACPECGAVPAK